MFVRNANPGATEAELLQRDRLAHALMYLSRGNPVVYYGDEQGFTGAGGDQDARQDMFPSQSPQYNNQDDPIAGDDGAGQERQHRLRRDADGRQLRPGASALSRARSGSRRSPAATRRCATARSSTGSPPRRRGLRVLAHRPHATGASTSSRSTTPRRAASASIPTYVRKRQVGEGLRRRPAPAAQRRATRHLDVTLGPLSAVVYRAKKRIPRSQRGAVGLARRARPTAATGSRCGADLGRRLVLRGDVPGQGRRRPLAGHRHRRQRARTASSTTCPTSRRARRVKYRAVVLDNAHHTRSSAVAQHHGRPAGDRAGGADRRTRACAGPSRCARRATPEHANYVVTFERSVDGGAVHGHRHGRLVARLHGVRRHVEPRRRGDA